LRNVGLGRRFKQGAELPLAGLSLLAKIIQLEPTKVFPSAHAGHTKLALFGLGNIKDERLHRTFLNKKACGAFVSW
jgi:hypothetical protein